MIDIPDLPPAGHIYGVPVYTSPFLDNLPRFTLSQEVPVTEEFRIRFNNWARDFFGTESRVMTLGTPPKKIVMGEDAWRRLEQSMIQSGNWRPT